MNDTYGKYLLQGTVLSAAARRLLPLAFVGVGCCWLVPYLLVLSTRLLVIITVRSFEYMATCFDPY
jgi:hypothetical protein